MDTITKYPTSVQVRRSLSDCGSSETHGSEEDMAIIKKGPWTEDEDAVLANYVAIHGEGHWNSVARCSGLKRTGKSCRLRWLNYLRPNVRRGNITLQEQLMILELHSRWGNRWSKIAEQLPGRTDNEIKNYWRTRVVKQARQLKCDVNSKEFRNTMRFEWIPRLMERIQATSCSNTKAHSETCGANPLVLSSEVSSYSSGIDAQRTSVSESNVAYNLMGGSTSNDRTSGIEENTGSAYSEIQAFEIGNGFGGADLWTDENIWFLQQQLSDL